MLLTPLTDYSEYSLSHNYDYGLLFAVFVLTVAGFIVFSSAIRSYSNYSGMFRNQLISIVLGLVMALFISLFDYRLFKIAGIGLYLISIMLLVLVLVKGVVYGGGKSWLKIPFFSTFQPSEIAKIAVVLVTSIFLARITDKEGKLWLNIVCFGATALLPIGLIIKQNDMGTSIIYLFSMAVMVFICGITLKYVFIAAGSFVLMLPPVWAFVLDDYQKGRILAVLQPDTFAETYSYNIIRAQNAVSAGGFWGQGLFKGELTGKMYVPVQESDFIFSVMGEETGFFGCMLFIILIFSILLKITCVSAASRDSYGRYVSLGLMAMLTFQYIENICGCIGIVPVTGIPLPFISQGGSAMLANFMAVGIILSISARRRPKRDVVDKNLKNNGGDYIYD